MTPFYFLCVTLKSHCVTVFEIPAARALSNAGKRGSIGGGLARRRSSLHAGTRLSCRLPRLVECDSRVGSECEKLTVCRCDRSSTQDGWQKAENCDRDDAY